MRGQVYSIDVVLGTTLLLLALTLLVFSTPPSIERAPEADIGQVYLLNAMKEAGILAEGITNQTALEEVLNNTPSSLCADLTLFEVKDKGKGNGDDDGDDKGKGEGHGKCKGEGHEKNEEKPGHDEDECEDEEDDEDDNGDDDNDGGDGAGQYDLTEVLTLTKEDCDYALAENLTISQFFSTVFTLKNNGDIDKFYVYRMRTWPKVS